ncbi:hypothetical protein FJZ53_04355, partial [Candidatus Woesearchaeota archaeon]|nr:hypothetical protein [Candidatus Woesearchaeota archaeon]
MAFQKTYSVMDRENLIKEAIRKDRIIERLKKENERLEKELKKYENAHTPSSQKRFCKVEVRGLK